MTLGELLKTLSNDDYVGIWDIRYPLNKHKSVKRFQTHPTPQTYSKVGNLPWERLRHVIDLDVISIIHNDKGFFIEVSDYEKTRESLRHSDLASKVAKSIRIENARS